MAKRGRVKKTGRLLDRRSADGSYPFAYTPSHATNVAATIARERLRIDQERAANQGRTVTRLPPRRPR